MVLGNGLEIRIFGVRGWGLGLGVWSMGRVLSASGLRFQGTSEARVTGDTIAVYTDRVTSSKPSS